MVSLTQGVARELLRNRPAIVPRSMNYSPVARQLSVGALARAGARRFYRLARRFAYRPGRADPSTRAAASASLAGPTAEGIVRSSARPGWADVSRRADVLSVLQRLPGAVERAWARAERAARREFDLFGTPLSFGPSGRIDWSLDPLSGHRYPLAPSHAMRLDVPGADPKYPWVLGRLDQLVALGQGYWASTEAGDRARFATQFVEQAGDFIRSNPTALGIHWTSPMEVSLRAANLASALSMFRDAPQLDQHFVLALLESLFEHGRFVEAHLEDSGAVPNNHLIADHLGVLAVGVAFPESPQGRRWAAASARRLSELIAEQVHPDGYSFEGSTAYHRLVLELFTLAQITAAAGGIDLGPSFAERLRKMFHVAGAYCSERGLAPQIGDNDSGRVFPLRDRESLDQGYLPALGAALFGDASLKRTGVEFPDEAAWLLGQSGWERFESLPAAAPPRSFGSPRGGLYVLRGSGAAVSVSAGPQGQKGVGGHSHNDKLSFELHLEGTPVIVDSGTGTYLRDRALRDWFRGTAAHNTVQLGEEEQAPLDPARPFALPSDAPTVVERFESDGDRMAVVARHGRLAQVRRELVLDLAERALFVSDQVADPSSRRATGRLHLPDRRVRIRPARDEERSRAGRACKRLAHFGAAAAEIGQPDAPLAVVLFGNGLQIRAEESRYSPGYGVLQPATTLVYSAEAEPSPVLTFVVLFA